MTIFFTVGGQLLLKWRMNLHGSMPEALRGKLDFFIGVFSDFYVIGGFAAAFLASLAWIAALTKFDLSFAYPFTSLSFVIVFGLSYYLFNEPISLYQIGGLALIILGLILASKGGCLNSI